MLRTFSKKFFIIVNVIAVILFLLACAAPYVNPGRYWYIAILGVGFPFIILMLLLFILFWWFFKSKWLLLSFFTLIVGWFQVDVVFAFHPLSSFSEKKQEHTVRIMQWNVARLGQMNRKKTAAYSRSGIFTFIKQMDPDILCMEEFLESNRPREMEENIPYISKALNYPYYYFARDHKRRDKLYDHGVIIFSRYPFLDTSRIRYTNTVGEAPGESLTHADVEIDGQRIRVFATHLQSLKFETEDYSVLEKIAKAEDSAVSTSKGVLKKFRTGYELRSSQAELVREQADSSPYPAVICGDFNDVPNSYTYFTVRGNRNDAFLKKGFGIGRTFTSLSPTLRIDYIMADKKLQPLQCKKWRVFYSDHFPLVADFKLPGKD